MYYTIPFRKKSPPEGRQATSAAKTRPKNGAPKQPTRRRTRRTENRDDRHSPKARREPTKATTRERRQNRQRQTADNATSGTEPPQQPSNRRPRRTANGTASDNGTSRTRTEQPETNDESSRTDGNARRPRRNETRHRKHPQTQNTKHKPERNRARRTYRNCAGCGKRKAADAAREAKRKQRQTIKRYSCRVFASGCGDVRHSRLAFCRGTRAIMIAPCVLMGLSFQRNKPRGCRGREAPAHLTAAGDRLCPRPRAEVPSSLERTKKKTPRRTSRGNCLYASSGESFIFKLPVLEAFFLCGLQSRRIQRRFRSRYVSRRFKAAE